MAEEIDGNLFNRKRDDLLKEKDEITLKIEAASRQCAENADLAINTFQLSQSLEEKWVNADIAEKRQLLKIVCLNFFLDGVTLCQEMRKPFDILAKRPSVSSTRSERISLTRRLRYAAAGTSEGICSANASLLRSKVQGSSQMQKNPSPAD